MSISSVTIQAAVGCNIYKKMKEAQYGVDKVLYNGGGTCTCPDGTKAGEITYSLATTTNVLDGLSRCISTLLGAC